MTTPSSGGSGFDDQETSLGGADAVPDTRGLPAHGTEPEQAARGSARAQVGSSGGLGAAGWIAIVVIALVILAIYGSGIFR